MERRQRRARGRPRQGKRDLAWPELGCNCHRPRSPDRAQDPGSTLGFWPRSGEKKRGFCVWRPLRARRLGADQEWPRRAQPRAAAWPPRASTPQAQLLREKGCQSVRRSAEWPRLVPQWQSHSQYGISVFLFLRLTWPLRSLCTVMAAFLAVLPFSHWIVTAGRREQHGRPNF